jgi:hypothetical protein
MSQLYIITYPDESSYSSQEVHKYLFHAEISSTNNLGSASNDIMLKIQKIKVPKEYTIFDHLTLN